MMNILTRLHDEYTYQATEAVNTYMGNSKSVQPKFRHYLLRIGRNLVYMKYLWSYEASHNLSLIYCMASWLKP